MKVLSVLSQQEELAWQGYVHIGSEEYEQTNQERLVELQPIEGDLNHYKQLTKIPAFMIWVLRKS